MDRKCCFFIGHREATREIYPALLAEVERHICEFGVTQFVVGHYGGFDRLPAEAVMEAKTEHEGIELVLLLPHHPAERPIYKPDGFDYTYYPFGIEKVPQSVAIVRANRRMVEQADYLIAYVWHTASNAANLLEYAQRRAGKGMLTITLLKRG